MQSHRPARRSAALRSVVVTALSFVALLSGCGEVEPIVPKLEKPPVVDFVPPPPPEPAWYDLPTGRREREAEQAAERDEATREHAVAQVSGILGSQSCLVADALMGPDGRAWLDGLADRARLAGYPALGRHVTGRGIAAACLLYAIDARHVPPARRHEAWAALDRVVGASDDWPGPPTVLASSHDRARETGGGLDLRLRGASDPLRARSRAGAAPPGVDVYLRILDGLEADIGFVTIPREPPEGWNPAAKRVFSEMPAVLREAVDTEALRAKVSSHAEMRGW